MLSEGASRYWVSMQPCKQFSCFYLNKFVFNQRKAATTTLFWVDESVPAPESSFFAIAIQLKQEGNSTSRIQAKDNQGKRWTFFHGIARA